MLKLQLQLVQVLVLVTLVPYALGFPHLANFPKHRSLAGLSTEEVRAVAQSFGSTPGAQPRPPPINDTSAKLVNDPDHPYMPDQPGDIRGPCPGLNTLAAHGYISRNGMATPGEIITAVQEGFNMGYDLGSFLTYAAFVVDGNHLTNLVSIGTKVTVDEEITLGLNTHGALEGDASITRGDYYFGDNHSFNETLFDQLVDAANSFGNGQINLRAVAEHKKIRIDDSMARNPTFFFETPRVETAYAESSFLLAFFESNQTALTTLNVMLDSARSFFQDHKYPDGFYRRQAPYGIKEFLALSYQVLLLVGVLPGHNEGAGNYVLNPEDQMTLCHLYQRQVDVTARLHPDPDPELKNAIKANLVTFYQSLGDPSCPQLFPYGQ